MAGFNQFYYSFSPTIADWERENPVFKQFVKLAISPLLTTLSILNYFEIDSEEEMLGFGIAIILLNIAIYFLVPFLTIVTISNYIKSRSRRTCCSNQSNHLFKSIKYHIKSVKSKLVVLALVLILVSVPSAFAQEPDPVNPDDIITSILDQSKNNIEDAITQSGQIPQAGQILYDLGVTEYTKALDALEKGDAESANDHAIVAMSLFEDALGTVNENAANIEIGVGQGIGLGNAPPGLEAVFNLEESITNSETEANNLKNLISDNGLDISLNDYDGSINLAKELLANGDVPSAHAKLDLANEIIDELYGEIKEESADIYDEQLKEFVDNTIADLESMIDAAIVLSTNSFKCSS